MMSLKEILNQIAEDITFPKKPEEWELPFYGFKKGSEGLKQVDSLTPAQKSTFEQYRMFFNNLLKKYGSAVRRNFSLTSPAEKEELTKLRTMWERMFPMAKVVVPDRATKAEPKFESINESEDDRIKNEIVAKAIEMVGIIPERDEKDAERILKKYNNDYDLALSMIANQISKTDNKSISERFVNCIRVIHAMKLENEKSGGHKI